MMMLAMAMMTMLIISDQEFLLPVFTVGNGLLVLVPSVPFSLSYLSAIIGMVVAVRMTMMPLMLTVSPHG